MTTRLPRARLYIKKSVPRRRLYTLLSITQSPTVRPAAPALLHVRVIHLSAARFAFAASLAAASSSLAFLSSAASGRALYTGSATDSFVFRYTPCTFAHLRGMISTRLAMAAMAFSVISSTDW